MSDSALRQRNRGCYTNPFSGVGMEFYPLGLAPEPSGVLLHETGYLARNDWWNFPNTLSPFWRLYYNFRPGHQVVFPNAAYGLTPDRIVLIPDHQLFHSVGQGAVPHLWMTFQVARRLDRSQAVPIVIRVTAWERQLLRRLAGRFTGIGEGDRHGVQHLSLALIHLLLGREEIRWQEGAPSSALRRAIQHLETQFATAIQMPQVARLAGLSVRGFAKAFAQHQGVPPGRFLLRVRVREAANLLANTNASIDQIAEQTGFPNRHYLSRVFRRLTGDSPAHFRRRHGGAGLPPRSSTAGSAVEAGTGGEPWAKLTRNQGAP